MQVPPWRLNFDPHYCGDVRLRCFAASTLSFLCGPFGHTRRGGFPCDGKSPCVFSGFLLTQGGTFRALLTRRFDLPCFLSASIFLALSVAPVSLLTQGGMLQERFKPLLYILAVFHSSRVVCRFGTSWRVPGSGNSWLHAK